ncbi:hypothetical protein SAMN05880501_10744 [Ureibacillus xyleni]|uniref:Uncharacterized protein n=2 Tax=Ureibacillus xyleni TaxID=614648 RepID=A0A285SVX4_9BACL|nr:hypothetical protein SAMN05880501_10744 [Ureibacillus xyleni]
MRAKAEIKVKEITYIKISKEEQEEKLSRLREIYCEMVIHYIKTNGLKQNND